MMGMPGMPEVLEVQVVLEEQEVLEELMVP